MTWVRIDDHFDDEPEVLDATAEDVGVWLRLKAYANRKETDGFVPDQYLRAIQRRGWNVTRALEHMISIQMLARDDERGGVTVLRHLETNPSREKLEAEREQKSTAGRKAGQASAEARARKQAETLAREQRLVESSFDHGSTVPDPVPSRPVPSRPDPVPESRPSPPEAGPSPPPSEPLRLEPQSSTRLRSQSLPGISTRDRPRPVVDRDDVVRHYMRCYEARYFTPRPPGMNIGFQAADRTAKDAVDAARAELDARSGEGDLRTLALEAITHWCSRYLESNAPAVVQRHHALQCLPLEIGPAGYPAGWRLLGRPAAPAAAKRPHALNYTPQSNTHGPRAWAPQAEPSEEPDGSPHVRRG